MNSPLLLGLALLAKSHPFFAPSSATMQSVPNHRAKKTEDVSDYGRDHDEGNRSHWIERFNEVNLLNHVRPENEIEDRLRPAKQNENRPNEMPPADQCADHQPNLVGVSHRYSL
jgi:hypothetical protein